jgi:hypothetical protein
VIGAVADAVIRPIVTRCHANRYPHRGSCLERLVERRHRLRGPIRFGSAPADRNDRWLVGRVVDCRGDCIEEAGIGVRREIDDDLGSRRDCPGNLDVQHDLAVRPVAGARRMVLSVVHRRSEHRRLAYIQPGEIPLQVGCAVAAAELDDGDALALPGSGGEAVQGSELGRRERGGRRSGRMPLDIAVRRKGSEMRARLRPIVEPEHGGNHSV